MNISPLDPWIAFKIGQMDLDKWQLMRLKDTINLVSDHSPFYKQRLKGYESAFFTLDRIAALPFTTPEDIRREALRLVCVSQDEIQRVVTLQTSGTTGEPKRLYFTAEDQDLTIDFFGIGMSTFTNPGDRVMIFLPGEIPNSVGDLLKKGLQLTGRIPISYGPIKDPEHALMSVKSETPDCLVGSPTQLLGLARRWQSFAKPPKTVLLSTDHVPNAIKDYLESKWGCEVYNHYGSTEMGLGGGVECQAHDGLHLREADLYFEVVHPQTGEPLPYGEYGEVVFSTLTRKGMPLLRYRTGDVSRLIPGPCKCGSHARRLEIVRNRLSGQVHVGEGILTMAYLDEAIFGIEDVLNFTAELTTMSNIEILKIAISTLFDRNLESEVKTKLSGLTDLRIEVECIENKAETGSLQKRKIIDHRGENA